MKLSRSRSRCDLERPVRATAPSLGITGRGDSERPWRRPDEVSRAPNRALAAMTALGAMAWLALLFWILVQLRGVFRTLRAGRPFVPANAGRIRRIGYGIIVGGARDVRARRRLAAASS